VGGVLVLMVLVKLALQKALGGGDDVSYVNKCGHKNYLIGERASEASETLLGVNHGNRRYMYDIYIYI